MGNIVLLDELTINKIAAGEVIERPASVIKEMVENSIDAGATNIVVEIKNGGISYIRITDNGKGIAKDDLEIAFERHATSKIRSADDLNTVKSMGFRGEALASIAAIANVELCSKTANDEIGHKIVVEGGKVLEQEECGCINGTTITVRNLFYNTPVRYKFLKKDFTESGYIEDAITRLALVNLNVAFKLINTGKTVIQTNGDGNINNVVFNIYGKDTAKALIPLQYTYDDITMTGVIGKPEIARSNRGNQLFFVNKRYVKDKTLSSATEKAFKGLLPIGKFGFVVINIEMEPSLVDVNVHPAKLEVRFQDDSKVFKAVYNAIKDSMLKADLIQNVSEDKETEYKPNNSNMSPLESFRNIFNKTIKANVPATPTMTIEDVVAEKIAREKEEELRKKQEEANKIDENNYTSKMPEIKISEPETVNNMPKIDETKNTVKEEPTNNILENIFLSREKSQNTVEIPQNDDITRIVNTEEINKKLETEPTVNMPIITNMEENIESEEKIHQEELQNKVNEEKSEKLVKKSNTEKEVIDSNTEEINKTISTGDVITNIIKENVQAQTPPTPKINFEEMYNKIFGRKKQEEEEKEQEERIYSAKDIINENISLYDKDEPYSEQNEMLNYKLIGIAFDTYIIIEIKKELYIVDQHAAHERILYEKVRENYYSDTNKDSQLMLLPDIITLSHKEMDIARDNMRKFKRAGFQLEEFGENTIKLTGVPTMCLDLNTRDLFLEILDEINNVARTAKQEVEDRFLETIACKAAVKANMALSPEEIDSLLKQLLALPNPFTCPHGRPTAIKMTKADLEKKFARRK